MLRPQEEARAEFEIICLEDFIPEDHLLRKIAAHIDFSFIHDIVKDLYSETRGRPAIDPVLLIKMLLIGYLYGIRSERQLEQEIRLNLAYRWFLGLKISDRIPHHSTISFNRTRRFQENGVFQEVFDEIVRQAMKHRLVEGRVLFTDSTHLKANANKKKFELQQVPETAKEYLQELDAAVEKDRLEHGKKPLKPRKRSGTVRAESPEKAEANLPFEGEAVSEASGESAGEARESQENTVVACREIKVSTTDKDSGYMYREGKPEGFFYLDHRTVDYKFNLITDVYITPGNVHDSIPYISRLNRQQEVFGFHVEAVALDSAYLSSSVCQRLKELDIFGVIGHRRYSSPKGMIPKRKFRYDEERDCYICPCGQELQYRTTTREGYREYASKSEVCRKCEVLKECTRSSNCRKVLTRHVWSESMEEVRDNRLSEEGKRLYKARSQTVERSFADAKELHGYRYCRYRGREKVQEQALLTASAQNIKKMALILSCRNTAI